MAEGKILKLADNPAFVREEAPIQIELPLDQIIEFHRDKIRLRVKAFIASHPKDVINYLDDQEQLNPTLLDEELKFIRSVLKIEHLDGEDCLNGFFEFLLVSRNLMTECNDNKEELQSCCKSISEQIFIFIEEYWGFPRKLVENNDQDFSGNFSVDDILDIISEFLASKEDFDFQKLQEFNRKLHCFMNFLFS